MLQVRCVPPIDTPIKVINRREHNTAISLDRILACSTISRRNVDVVHMTVSRRQIGDIYDRLCVMLGIV